MKKKSLIVSGFVLFSLLGTGVLFQNSTTPSLLTNSSYDPYSRTHNCSIYVYFDKRSPVRIGQTRNQLATRSPKDCSWHAFVNYSASSSSTPGCGYSKNIYDGIPNKYLKVFGILEEINSPTGFDSAMLRQNVLKISVPQGRVIASPPTLCGEGVERLPTICDYDKSKFCVQKHSPILSQSSPELASYISKATNNPSIKKDTGWCAPVATAMSLAGAIYSNKWEVHQDQYLWSSRLPIVNSIEKNDMNKRTGQFGEMIYGIGNKMNTYWSRGGTYAETGIQFLYYQIDTRIRNRSHSTKPGQVAREFYSLENQNLTTKNIIDKFKAGAGANVMLLSTGKYVQECPARMTVLPSRTIDRIVDRKLVKSTIKRYQFNFECVSYNPYTLVNSYHAVSVNGVEDGYVKIYDPWGRIYNVKMHENQTLIGVKGKHTLINVVIGSPNHTRGFISNNEVDKKEIIIEVPEGERINNEMIKFASRRFVNVGNVTGFLTNPIP